MVKDDNGYANLLQFKQMLKVYRVLRRTDDDTLHMHVHQHFYAVDLVFVVIVRIGDDAHIPGLACFSLDALHDVGVGIERDVGHDDADNTCCVVAQAYGKGVGPIASLLCQLFYLSLQFGAYAFETSQGS